ncbi:unnamed protein product [Clonostachys byssicola]|uniref:Uncharacterized protein n=1 Tax=Clonostachys byssicola TaxID=160290 RepID=A0A9N9UXR2_9HYPO|nr:unnamed protein product [Clonostachys byssicola]
MDMDHRQAHAKCGGAIALLEGRQNIPLPDDIISASTLPDLDKRLRRLEGKFSILPPPAGLDPTWDSLALRLYRVQREDNRTPTLTPAPVRSLPNSFLDLVPAPSAVPIETLQTLCSEIKLVHGLSRSSQHGKPWPKYASDDDALDVVRQRLCHAAGQTPTCRLGSIPYTRSEIYAALVDLTVEPPPRPIPFPARGPLPGRPPLSSMKKKACCGCCACDCHPRKVAADDASSVSSLSRGRGRGGLFGFLGKLAFWRRPKVMSDKASFSSG